MELIVDANVLLAAFLKEATTRELVLDARLTLRAPEHLLAETSRHLKTSAAFRKRIKIAREELQELFGMLTQRIQTFPMKAYKTYWSEALSLAPHEEDAPYLALALLLKNPIWSNDKGVGIQKRVTVHTTASLLEILERQTD